MKFLHQQSSSSESTSVTVPIATTQRLGVVKVGDGLTIEENGTIGLDEKVIRLEAVKHSLIL